MNQKHTQKQQDRFLFSIFSAWTFVMMSRPQDIFTFLAPIRPALILGIFTFLVLILRNPGFTRERPFSNPQVKLYSILIVIMMLSIPFAIYRRGAFMFLFTSYVNVILFFFIFFRTVDSTKRLMRILFLACLGSILYSVSALIGGGFISGRLNFGGVFDPNDLASFTLSFLPLNLIFLSKENNLLRRFIGISGFVVGALVILLTGSRGGFVGFSIVVLMLLLTKTRAFRLSYKVVIGASILIIAFTKIVTIDFERYQTITNLEGDYNLTGEGGRVDVWKTGVRLMLSRPLTGVGIDCFNQAIGNDRGERGLKPIWQAAHNSLIQIGSETGILGFILFGLMSLKAFKIFGQVRKRTQSEELLKIGEMARMGFAGHFITGMFISQAYSIYWAFYIVLSAVLYRFMEKEMEISPRSSRADISKTPKVPMRYGSIGPKQYDASFHHS